MSSFSDKVTVIWFVANLIRNQFKHGKYQDMSLLLTVLQRINCVLEPTLAAVRAKAQDLKEHGLQNSDAAIRKESGFSFYNTSLFVEELLSKFNKALDENPKEHFTPREVVRLMVDIMLGRDRADLIQGGIALKGYASCCGTGGMITLRRQHDTERNTR